MRLLWRIFALIHFVNAIDNQDTAIVEEPKACYICLEEVKEAQPSTPDLLQCNHPNSYLHTECLQKWCQVNHICPMCRQKASTFYEYLFRQVKLGRINRVVRIVADGCDIDWNHRLDDGSAILHVVAEHGDVDILDFLVNKGADVNALAGDQSTVLHIAVQNDHFELVEYLMGLESFTEKLAVRGNRGRQAIHMAAHAGIADIVELIVESFPATANAPDANMQTPLHIAAHRGHEEVIAVLLDHGADPLLADVNLRTPLHKAVISGFLDIVENFLWVTDHIAATDGVSYIDKRDSDGNTALMLTTRYKMVEIFDILMNHGVNIDASDNQGSTSLHIAAKYQHDWMVLQLVKAGAELDAKDFWGRTALVVSIVYRCSVCTEILLEVDAGTDVGDNRKRTPLHHAIQTQQAPIVVELLSYNADVNSRDYEGLTPLMLASQYDFTGLTTQLLIDSDCDIKARNTVGRTALHLAIIRENIQTARLLYRQQPEVAQIADIWKARPLRYATAEQTQFILDREPRRQKRMRT